MKAYGCITTTTSKILNATIIPKIQVLLKSFFFYWKLVANSEHYQNLLQMTLSYFRAHFLVYQFMKRLAFPGLSSYFKRDSLVNSEFDDCSNNVDI